MNKPPSLLDPAFKYTNSVDTNIRQLFNRVRAELAVEKAKAEAQQKNAFKRKP